MTPDQFKAWFEGFCEGIGDAPTPEQWAKVKAKIADLRSQPPAQPLAHLPRDTGFQRYFDRDMTCGTSGEPLPARARVIAQNGHNARSISLDHPLSSGRISVSHETRVIDAVTGRDLGPSD